MKSVDFRVVRLIAKKVGSIFILALMLLLIQSVATAQTKKGNQRNRGGVPGDTFIYSILYSAENCPLPATIKDNYTTISFCGLGSRSNKPTEIILNVDGYTNLASGTILDVSANVPVTLPCGNVVSLTRFTATSFTQTSPPPPPFRFATQSTKVNNTCR